MCHENHLLFIYWYIFLEIEEGGQGYSVTDTKEHEAGYDSFITGLSFLAMWKYLGKQLLMFLKLKPNVCFEILSSCFVCFILLC